jgi:hypothetical protein
MVTGDQIETLGRAAYTGARAGVRYDLGFERTASVATSHYCNGKWRPGTVAACPKHTALSKRQPSVYRTPEEGPAPSKGGSGPSSGDTAPSGS